MLRQLTSQLRNAKQATSAVPGKEQLKPTSAAVEGDVNEDVLELVASGGTGKLSCLFSALGLSEDQFLFSQEAQQLNVNKAKQDMLTSSKGSLGDLLHERRDTREFV